jgi:hypothetical protein
MLISEICQALQCSRATAYRLRHNGQLGQRLAAAQKQKSKTHDVPINKNYEEPGDISVHPSESTPQIKTDLQFAQQYLAGEVCDSFGNYHSSPRKQSALGPLQFEPEPQSHLVSYWGMPTSGRRLSQQETKQLMDIRMIASAWTHGLSR